MENVNTTKTDKTSSIPANNVKPVSGNPDVNFGADESGSNDVEVNTGNLGDSNEIDLDRSGVNEGSENGEDQAKGFKKETSFQPDGYGKSGGTSDAASPGI